jgi:hypothetical protein
MYGLQISRQNFRAGSARAAENENNTGVQEGGLTPMRPVSLIRAVVTDFVALGYDTSVEGV